MRWTIGGIAAVVLALAVAWVLFVPSADWLAQHDVGSVGRSLHETALDNARGQLLTLGAGLFAAGALFFTARNFALSREGQVTDRYAKAVEQLGSDKLDVRIGGIYSLERVARDSARDHPTVMDVLTAFIRGHSLEQWPPSDHPASQEQERSTRPDVQAALTVVGRRDSRRDIRPIDLEGANLTNANLWGARLSGANLPRAFLTRASLSGADLSGADLSGADLRGAFLTAGATLANARLADANLTGAHLLTTTLTRADFTNANLSGADLIAAGIAGARFVGADLTNTRWPTSGPVPENWRWDPVSRLLERADH